MASLQPQQQQKQLDIQAEADVLIKSIIGNHDVSPAHLSQAIKRLTPVVPPYAATFLPRLVTLVLQLAATLDNAPQGAYKPVYSEVVGVIAAGFGVVKGGPVAFVRDEEAAMDPEAVIERWAELARQWCRDGKMGVVGMQRLAAGFFDLHSSFLLEKPALGGIKEQLLISRLALLDGALRHELELLPSVTAESTREVDHEQTRLEQAERESDVALEAAESTEQVEDPTVAPLATLSLSGDVGDSSSPSPYNLGSHSSSISAFSSPSLRGAALPRRDPSSGTEEEEKSEGGRSAFAEGSVVEEFDEVEGSVSVVADLENRVLETLVIRGHPLAKIPFEIAAPLASLFAEATGMTLTMRSPEDSWRVTDLNGRQYIDDMAATMSTSITVPLLLAAKLPLSIQGVNSFLLGLLSLLGADGSTDPVDTLAATVNLVINAQSNTETISDFTAATISLADIREPLLLLLSWTNLVLCLPSPIEHRHLQAISVVQYGSVRLVARVNSSPAFTGILPFLASSLDRFSSPHGRGKANTAPGTPQWHAAALLSKLIGDWKSLKLEIDERDFYNFESTASDEGEQGSAVFTEEDDDLTLRITMESVSLASAAWEEQPQDQAMIQRVRSAIEDGQVRTRTFGDGIETTKQLTLKLHQLELQLQGTYHAWSITGAIAEKLADSMVQAVDTELLKAIKQVLGAGQGDPSTLPCDLPSDHLILSPAASQGSPSAAATSTAAKSSPPPAKKKTKTHLQNTSTLKSFYGRALRVFKKKKAEKRSAE